MKTFREQRINIGNLIALKIKRYINSLIRIFAHILY